MSTRRPFSPVFLMVLASSLALLAIAITAFSLVLVANGQFAGQSGVILFTIINLLTTLVIILVAVCINLLFTRRLRLMEEMNLKINQAILLDENIEQIYDLVLKQVFDIFRDVRYGSVLVVDESGILHFAASRGFTEDYARNFSLPLTDCFLYRQTSGNLREATLITNKTLREALHLIEPENWSYQSVISAPLFRDGQLFGLLNLDSSKKGTFNNTDVRMVEHLRLQIEVCLLARSRYQESIQRLNIDALTGLSTRRFFEDLFLLSVERANRYGESFVLALFDADGLKQVNDRFGHLAGDQLLVAMANTLRCGHRKSDIIGRFGGDEFIAVYHSTTLPTMRQAIKTILDACREKPLELGGEKWPLSFCFGLAHYPEDGTELKDLIAVADHDLYTMKSARRKPA